MKKALNIALLLSSFIGYLEWPENNHAYLFEIEAGIITGLGSSQSVIAHPFVFVPLIGQILLIITLFQRVPGRILSLLAVACISLIMLMLLLIGLMGLNTRMMAFAAPFLVLAFISFLVYRKKKNTVPVDQTKGSV